MWSPHSPVAIVLACNSSASMHAGELKILLRYECNVRRDIRGSLYSYISKQLAGSKQEITSQAATTKLYLRSALIQQPESEKMHLNKNLSVIKL